MREEVVMRKTFALPCHRASSLRRSEARTAPLIAVPDELGRNAGDDKSEQPVEIVHANPEHAQTDMDAAVKAAAAAVAKAQKKSWAGKTSSLKSKAAQLILAGTGAENAAVSSAAARVMAEAWGCGIRVECAMQRSRHVGHDVAAQLAARSRRTASLTKKKQSKRSQVIRKLVNGTTSAAGTSTATPPVASCGGSTRNSRGVLRLAGAMSSMTWRGLCSSWFDGCALCSKTSLKWRSSFHAHGGRVAWCWR